MARGGMLANSIRRQHNEHHRFYRRWLFENEQGIESWDLDFRSFRLERRCILSIFTILETVDVFGIDGIYHVIGLI